MAAVPDTSRLRRVKTLRPDTLICESAVAVNVKAVTHSWNGDPELTSHPFTGS
jgi:hypothetical protein